MNIAIILPIDIRNLSVDARRRCYGLSAESHLSAINVSFSTACSTATTMATRSMGDLVKTVMEAAARELLHQEATQVDLEMEQLLAEMALFRSVEDSRRDFTRRFFALLKCRGEIARRALGIAKRHSASREPLEPALRAG